jgi:hypothetical protein
MHCIYCNTDYRSLLEPDGGDSCDPFAQPNLASLPIGIQARVLKKARKPRKRAA